VPNPLYRADMPDKPQKNTENQPFWGKSGSIGVKTRNFSLQAGDCFTYKQLGFKFLVISF
jgi:hypothetical protein